MINYIFEPINLRQAKKLLHNKKINHLLLNVMNFSITINKGFTEKEINYLLKNKKYVKISLCFNRIFHEDELLLIEELLKKIDISLVEYIIYSDLGFHQLAKRLNISSKLVYDAYTYLTNSLDVNLYSRLNNKVVISNQISINELKVIDNNLEKEAIIHAFGKSIIFYSKRKLMTNYMHYRKMKRNPFNKNYYLKEEFRNEKYHFFEDNFGSYFYEQDFYYLFDELSDLSNICEAIIHSADLNVKMYQAVIDSYINHSEEKLKNLPIGLGKGIMEKDTVLLKESSDKNV